MKLFSKKLQLLTSNIKFIQQPAPLLRLHHLTNREPFLYNERVWSSDCSFQFELKIRITSSCSFLKPVYSNSFYNLRNNHLYATVNSEVSAAVSRGYVNEGIAFYCTVNFNECDATEAFHRYYVGFDVWSLLY